MRETHLALEEIDDAVQKGVEVDFDGAACVAVEAEGLLGDLGNAGELGVSGFEQVLSVLGHGGVGLAEVDEVGHGLERVVDLMRYGRGEASGGGELFALAQGGLLVLREVMSCTVPIMPAISGEPGRKVAMPLAAIQVVTPSV